jgi:hypothetical protein
MKNFNATLIFSVYNKYKEGKNFCNKNTSRKKLLGNLDSQD